MPREQINFPAPFVPPADDDSTVPPVHGEAWAEPIVHVSWSAATGDYDGHVQLVVEADPAYFTFAAANPGDNSLGRAAVFSPSLDRSHLNKLIRMLRRGRDQAYGRDE